MKNQNFDFWAWLDEKGFTKAGEKHWNAISNGVYGNGVDTLIAKHLLGFDEKVVIYFKNESVTVKPPRTHQEADALIYFFGLSIGKKYS